MLAKQVGAMALALILCACNAQSRETAQSLPVPTQTLTAAGDPARGPYAPQDDCAELPGFAAFRDSLFAAVDARDAGALIALSHPAVKLDFGGGAGIDEFRRRLDAGDELWRELARLEPLGCARTETGQAVMPWIFAEVPDDVDAFETWYVVGNDVPLLSQPDAAAEVARTLSHDLVTVTGEDVAGYLPVETTGTDPVGGHVAQANLRSLVDYRLIVEPSPRGWQIAAFVAGD